MLNSHKTKSNTHTLQFMFAQNNCSFWPEADLRNIKRLLSMTQLIQGVPYYWTHFVNDPIAIVLNKFPKNEHWLYVVKLTLRSLVPTLILQIQR